MKKALVVLAILGAIALPASQVHAACPASTPMFHGYGSYLACDNGLNGTNPVSAFAYQVSAPTTVNTGTETITRNQATGQVLIDTDWAQGGILGCPVTAVNNRVMVVVQANDGRGVLLSLSGASPDLGYAVEAAHPNDPAGIALPLICNDLNGRPHLNGLTTNTVDITVPKPKIFTDCDADSVGVVVLGGATCLDAFDVTAAAATVGGVFTSTQPCGQKPNTNRSAPAPATWTRQAVTLDATGRGTVPYTKPTTVGDCAFVGTTTTVGGVEGGSINGFIQIGGLPASPTAEGVRAATDSGKVKLSWSTSNEVGLASFRLIAVSKNKGQSEIGSAIAANGSPSSYTAEVRLADLKGARSIIIRSVLTDGATVDAAPVNF